MSEEKKDGMFLESLKRSNSKIRQDRALSIAEDTEMIFKREVEDLEMRIKKLKRERDAMLDLSPGTTQSLEFPAFDAKEFVAQDLRLGLDIRNAEIKLEIARERYASLFGEGK